MAIGKILKLGLVVGICLAIFSFILVGYSKSQILKYGGLDPKSELEFDALNLSSSHYLYFTYKVKFDSEIKLAYWRMKSGHVEIEK